MLDPSRQVVVRQFAQANKGIWAGHYPALNMTKTENDTEINNDADLRILHKMAKINDFLEMWQGSHNLRATQKEFHTQKQPKKAVRYISDMEEIINASWLLFLQDGAAAFKLSERSHLPQALSAKDLPGGQTQILNVCLIKRINHHPAENGENSALERISDTKNLLNWNGNLDIPNDSEDNCMGEVESDIQQDNGIENPECAEQLDMRFAPNVPKLICPPQRSKTSSEKVLVTVNAGEGSRSKGLKKQ